MSEKKITTHRLSNGLQIIIFPYGTISKVSTQLWYRVGSRHETSQQRGLAHLLEHMTFKGTDKYSEADIDYITSYYAGHCNAFTSFDYTAYQFDFHQNAWDISLEILAECMTHCRFKPDLLNSERSAVIQELRMYQDDYESLLLEKMSELIFAPHSYAYPIIGYKNDIWSMNTADLSAFYTHYYQPQNATLVIGGFVDPQLALEKVVAAFESTPQGSYKPTLLSIPVNKFDITQQSVVLHREISVPIGMVAWVVPGLSNKMGFVLDCLLWVLVADKGSLLQKEFVERQELVTELSGFSYDLFEQGLLAIQFTPCEGVSITHINNQIQSYIKKLIVTGIEKSIVAYAHKKALLAHAATMESVAQSVSSVAELYLATDDVQYAFNYTEGSIDTIHDKINHILCRYLLPEYMHVGSVVPLKGVEKKKWRSLLQKEAESDALVRKETERNTVFEKKVPSLQLKNVNKPFIQMVSYESEQLYNGLRLLTCVQPKTLKVEIVLKLKADNQYDPNGFDGIAYCLSQMLLEGTQDFPGQSFIEACDANGIHVTSMPGVIAMSCSPTDVQKALELLFSMITQAEFTLEALDRIMKRIHSEIDIFWDDPAEFIVDAARIALYKNHPYGKLLLGTHETVNNITLEKLKEFYQCYYSPNEARLAIIGDFQKENVVPFVGTLFGKWQAKQIPDLKAPEISTLGVFTQINYSICRDQIALCFACPTVARMHPDYYILLLFEQIFSGGFLGSMNTRLYELREKTGLFYSINSSLLAYADLFPGMAYIMTLLSPDQLEEGVRLLKENIQTATDNWAEQDLYIARNAVLTGIIESVETQQSIAGVLLFLDRFHLPPTYFQDQIKSLEEVTLQDVKRVVSKYLQLDNMLLVTAGLCEE